MDVFDELEDLEITKPIDPNLGIPVVHTDENGDDVMTFEVKKRETPEERDQAEAKNDQTVTEDSEAKKDVLEFTKRYVALLVRQKELKEDIKALQQEYEEQGVPTKVCIKAVKMVQKAKKQSEDERCRVETYSMWIMQNKTLDDTITELIAK